ncbi:MAG: bifunctional oligoribonuclease/PAP phosphatase NrnA [Armatimonadetes bacterium CG07_land_8_20_14_0_80_40_9]|nr:MAG: bifunctional oligoribonuclease/PAP phosphatase NrnA [Armatimonadetes bacterium CG07_land_8_20_14_0_80_40_9]
MSPEEQIIKIIKGEQRFIVTSHINPDGDSIGSILALGLALRKVGKEVTIFSFDPIPKVYNFLPRIDLITRDIPFSLPKVVIVLDCGEIDSMIPSLSKLITPSSIVINIDHHQGNSKFGDYCYLDPKAAAVGEQIYKIIGLLGIRIDKEIAPSLYVAILTDTGSFKFINTTADTFRIASSLVKSGANPALISQKVYENKPLGLVRLMGLALTTLKLNKKRELAYLTITQDMLKKSKINNPEVRVITDFIRSIQGLKVVLVFRETKGKEIKVSLRSKGEEIDVNRIASKFGGGGHQAAAGCTLKGPIEEMKMKVLEEVELQISTKLNAECGMRNAESNPHSAIRTPNSVGI